MSAGRRRARRLGVADADLPKAARRGGVPHTGTWSTMADDHVINVCFHGVGKPTRELEPGEAGYWISEDQFNRILDEVVTWPAVRLSFDDGNASDVEIALPALLERGLCADFFALAGRLDMPGALDPDGVRELHRNGMRIGPHGMRHRSWRGMDADTSHDELGA